MSPGQSVRVTIFVPSTACPAQDTFTFKGPGNTATVQLSCTKKQQKLVVSSTHFNMNKDCDGSQVQVWICTAVLSSDPTNQSNLDWSASTSSSSGIYFTPQSGILTPGQSLQVTISVPNAACINASNGSFTFTGPENAVNVPWICTIPPTLTIDSDSFTAGANCPAAAGGWTCTTTLAPASGSQSDLNWSASSGLSGVTFTPSSGTLSPGQSVQVSVF